MNCDCILSRSHFVSLWTGKHTTCLYGICLLIKDGSWNLKWNLFRRSQLNLIQKYANCMKLLDIYLLFSWTLEIQSNILITTIFFKAIRNFSCGKIPTISNTKIPLLFDVGITVNACVRYFYKYTFLVICAIAIVCCPSSSSLVVANLENTLWIGKNDAVPSWKEFIFVDLIGFAK